MQTNPVKAIREKCLECSGGSSNEVQKCTVTACPLYAFRFGKNPYRTRREISEEQRSEMARRLQEARKRSATSVADDGREGENNDE